jgi:hypothetical protein
MRDKHEQLYVAVQDLLIELGVTPDKLRDIATNRTHGHIKPTITAKTAQKLIDADLIVEEINWRKPGKLIVSGKNNEVSEIDAVLSEKAYKDQDHTSVIKNFGSSIFDRALLTFDGIKSNLPPQTLWSYLQEAHPDFLLLKTNGLSTFPPGILWSYLREKYPEFLSNAIKDYLFPTQ